MPKYFYNATTLDGEHEAGTLEAENEKELAKILRTKGCILISTSLDKPKRKVDIFQILNIISLKDKLFFTRNLRLMIKSGISLPKALNILALQTGKKNFKEIIIKIKDEIIKGRKLSEVFKDYPKVFPELYCNMIEIGEETGNLEQVLTNLAKQMERTYELNSKVKGALMYPAVIIIAMGGIGIIMMVTVVPQLAKTFEELNIQLPFTTRIVLGTADFIIKYWFLFPVILLPFIFLFKNLLKSRGNNKLIDKIILKIPVVSSIIKETNIAYTARTLSALIDSGVPIVRSLEIISNALDNFYFKEAISAAAKEVKKGTKLSEALKPYSNVYPVTFSEMIAIGEETGETSDILEKVADFSESEVENATKNLSSVIEPVIMIVVGIAIGFFAVSMIQPMYSMLGSM